MPEINISIAKEKFLPIYRPLIMSDDVYDIDFLYGGRDSGKSRHIAMQLVVECMRSAYFRCLLIKKELYTIRGSQYQTIKDVIEEWGLNHLFAFNSSRLEIVCVVNGNGFYGKGLDDAGKVKSFANPSCCWIEEGNQITAEDFVIIQTSLRTNTGKVKVWFSFNPECEVTYSDFWLWQEYFSHTEQLSFTNIKTIETPKGPKQIAIRATHGTYLDNPYCSDERMALYESYKTSKNNAYWYQTYTLGLWGYKRPGGEFWKCFEEELHTAPIKHIPQLKNMTIHISVDSNVNPYVTVQVWQIDTQAKKLLQVDEIICEHPNNTASKSAKKVVDYLDRKGYNQAVYIYGDPAANAKSTVDDEGRSFFDKFIGTIKSSGFQYVNRVGKSAPSVSQSGAFINEIFEHGYDGWGILIDKSCRKSIEDYNMVVEDIDGKMLKKKVTNKETKVSYEKYGHCFVGETLITTDKGQVRIDCIKVGDMVLTRNGYKKVLNVWDNGVRKVVNYNIGGIHVTCTPDHHFYTKEYGFVNISLIHNGTFCIFDSIKSKICYQYKSITTGLNLIDTPKLKHEANEFTIQDGLRSTASGLKSDFMYINMNVKLVQYLKVIMCIISMKTQKTMTYLTLNLKQLKRTLQTTLLMFLMKEKNNAIMTLLQRLFPHQKNGMEARMVGSGIGNMQKNILPYSTDQSQEIATTALNNITVLEQEQDFVQTIASHHLDDCKERIEKQEFALSAQKNMSVTNIPHLKPVGDFAGENMQVYDLEVEHEHEYFANGILVHNCSDTMRYLITTVLANEYKQFLTRRNGIPRSGGLASVGRVSKVTP